jgi:hypothetical protein
MSSRKYKNAVKTKPFAIRLTDDERAELNRRAGTMAIGTYIKSVLFVENRGNRAKVRRPIDKHIDLAEVLAYLGSSRIGESLERLADATETGVLQFDPDAPAAIKRACADIIAMRLLLMKALGFQIDLDELEESLSQTFTRAAKDQ